MPKNARSTSIRISEVSTQIRLSKFRRSENDRRSESAYAHVSNPNTGKDPASEIIIANISASTLSGKITGRYNYPVYVTNLTGIGSETG